MRHSFFLLLLLLVTGSTKSQLRISHLSPGYDALPRSIDALQTVYDANQKLYMMTKHEGEDQDNNNLFYLQDQEWIAIPMPNAALNTNNSVIGVDGQNQLWMCRASDSTIYAYVFKNSNWELISQELLNEPISNLNLVKLSITDDGGYLLVRNTTYQPPLTPLRESTRLYRITESGINNILNYSGIESSDEYKTKLSLNDINGQAYLLKNSTLKSDQSNKVEIYSVQENQVQSLATPNPADYTKTHRQISVATVNGKLYWVAYADSQTRLYNWDPQYPANFSSTVVSKTDHESCILTGTPTQLELLNLSQKKLMRLQLDGTLTIDPGLDSDQFPSSKFSLCHFLAPDYYLFTDHNGYFLYITSKRNPLKKSNLKNYLCPEFNYFRLFVDKGVVHTNLILDQIDYSGFIQNKFSLNQEPSMKLYGSGNTLDTMELSHLTNENVVYTSVTPLLNQESITKIYKETPQGRELIDEVDRFDTIGGVKLTYHLGRFVVDKDENQFFAYSDSWLFHKKGSDTLINYDLKDYLIENNWNKTKIQYIPELGFLPQVYYDYFKIIEGFLIIKEDQIKEILLRDYKAATHKHEGNPTITTQFNFSYDEGKLIVSGDLLSPDGIKYVIGIYEDDKWLSEHALDQLESDSPYNCVQVTDDAYFVANNKQIDNNGYYYLLKISKDGKSIDSVRTLSANEYNQSIETATLSEEGPLYLGSYKNNRKNWDIIKLGCESPSPLQAELILDDPYAIVGDKVTLTCLMEEINDYEIEWYKNGNKIRRTKFPQNQIDIVIDKPSDWYSATVYVARNQCFDQESYTYEAASLLNSDNTTLNIWPNPATSHLHLKAPDNSPYLIYTTDGKILKSGKIKSGRIGLDGVDLGVYFLHLPDVGVAKFTVGQR